MPPERSIGQAESRSAVMLCSACICSKQLAPASIPEDARSVGIDFAPRLGQDAAYHYFACLSSYTPRFGHIGQPILTYGALPLRPESGLEAGPATGDLCVRRDDVHSTGPRIQLKLPVYPV